MPEMALFAALVALCDLWKWIQEGIVRFLTWAVNGIFRNPPEQTVDSDTLEEWDECIDRDEYVDVLSSPSGQ